MPPPQSSLVVAFDEQFPVDVVALGRKFNRPHTFECLGDGFAPELRSADDHRVVQGLVRHHVQVFCTLDPAMLDVPATLYAIEIHRLSVVAVEAVTHAPARAIGATMLWLPDVLGAYRPDEPQIFRWAPPHDRKYEKPRDLFGKMASKRNTTIQELRQRAEREFHSTA